MLSIYFLVFTQFCSVAVSLAVLPGLLNTRGERALYFLDNDASGNYIVAVEISNDNGTLSAPVKTATGGEGLTGFIAPSQDSVIVAGEYLFAVNSASNTLSLFTIDKNDPTRPALLGPPADTGGGCPLSVTYSERLNIACVLDGGDVVGVTCYEVDRLKGLQRLSPGLLMPINASLGPVVGAQDIRFNPSSTALFVTVGSDGNHPGLLYAWLVVDGKVGPCPLVSELPGVPVPFSLNFLGSDSRLLITNTDGTPGAAVLTVSTRGKVENISQINVPSHDASCWGAYTTMFDIVFVIDLLDNIISIVRASSETVLGSFRTPSPLGSIDSRVDRQYFYSITAPFDLATQTLASSPQILVYDISFVLLGSLPRLVQSFDIFNSVGTIPNLLGMAIYPTEKFT